IPIARQQNQFQQIAFRKQFAVSDGVPASHPCPLVQMTELHAKDCSLQRIEPAVYANTVIVIFAPGAMLSQCAKDLRHLRIVRGDHPPIAGASQVLGREEAEAPELSEASN